jgi:oxaloacetate decarboxylase alpha subunit
MPPLSKGKTHTRPQASEKKAVKLINSTLRDGLQAQWSGRLGEKEILPIVRSIDQAGYEAVDFMAPVQFEVCVKYLKENPWHRARSTRAAVQRTPLFTHLRSRSLTSFDLVHDSVFNLWVERIGAAGFKRVMVFDALHDIGNIQFSMQRAKAAGLEVCLVIFYTISPFHTDAFYARKARELAELGADSICLRDPSGLLTPERVSELVPIIRSGIGNTPFYLKSHCTTGQAEDCYLIAARHGVDALFVASEPLAHGASVPAIRRVYERLASEGLAAPLDVDRIQDEEDYFFDLARRTNRPIGTPIGEFDSTQYQHQIPGNMVAFTRGQLTELNMEHLLPKVLDEFVQVRADMGYPVMVTPISQLVCVQAVLNVVQGERYKSIPGEVRKYVLGAYGQPDAPIDSVLRDRVGSSRLEAEQEDPVAALRKRLHRDVSDDDLLLRILFRPEQLQGVPMDSRLAGGLSDTPTDAESLIAFIKGLPTAPAARMEVRRGDFSFSGKYSAKLTTRSHTLQT